jgi:hypothetical protein
LGEERLRPQGALIFWLLAVNKPRESCKITLNGNKLIVLMDVYDPRINPNAAFYINFDVDENYLRMQNKQSILARRRI